MQTIKKLSNIDIGSDYIFFDYMTFYIGQTNYFSVVKLTQNTGLFEAEYV